MDGINDPSAPVVLPRVVRPIRSGSGVYVATQINKSKRDRAGDR